MTETAIVWQRDLERRNRLVRRVLLAIVAALVLASFAIGIRW
jgi:hypothetical protein